MTGFREKVDSEGRTDKTGVVGENWPPVLSSVNEQVCSSLLGPIDPRLPGRNLGSFTDAKGRQDLDPGVAGVDLEGDAWVCGESLWDVLKP